MKLKYDFVINRVAGTTLAVPVGEGTKYFKGYIKLNETAAFIFKALMKGSEKEEIVSGIMKEFSDVSESDALCAVDEFLDELKKAEVLDD